MCVSIAGEADGIAGVAGICIPGVCVCGSFPGEADAVGGVAGICIPGVCVWWGVVCRIGDDDAFGRGVDCARGVFIPGMCIPAGMLLMSCFFAGIFLRRAGFLFRGAAFLFCFAFGFGLALLIPGILWPSCCAATLWPIENDKSSVADKIKYLYRGNILFMILTSLDGAGVSKKKLGNARDH
jgi:hypothetical protein